MYKQIVKPKENTGETGARAIIQTKRPIKRGVRLADNRPGPIMQQKLFSSIQNSPVSNLANAPKESTSNNFSAGVPVTQLFLNSTNRVMQLGKKGGDDDKKKGDDYCNNVGKSLRSMEDLLQGFLDDAIREQIAVIDANREKCSVSSNLVKGADTNTKEYGEFNRAMMDIAREIAGLKDETDKRFYNTNAKPLGQRLHILFNLLPTVAVDPRVAAVIRAGTEGDQRALALINEALGKLKDALQARILAYLLSIGPYKKLDKRPPDDPDGGAGSSSVGGGSMVEAVS